MMNDGESTQRLSIMTVGPYQLLRKIGPSTIFSNRLCWSADGHTLAALAGDNQNICLGCTDARSQRGPGCSTRT